ncbi:MAG: TolC family protein [Candidatus Reddybacter sp.]
MVIFSFNKVLNKSLLPALILAATGGFASLYASAENLNSAWQQALNQNKQVEAAKQNKLAALKQVDIAKAARLPSLALTAEYINLDNPPTLSGNSLAALPNAPPGQGMVNVPFEMQIAEDEAMLYSAVATLPLYTSGRISAGINAAKAQASASVKDQQQTTLDIKLAVAEAYIHVLQITEHDTIARAHIAALTSYKNDVTNLHRQGLVSRNDQLMASVALSHAVQEGISAKNQLAVASARYNQLLNRPLGTAFALEPLPLHGMSEDNIQTLTSRALTTRPELAALQHKIEALGFTAKTIKAVTLPQLYLSGVYRNLDNDLLLDDEVIAYGVNLVWPIFDGGITHHRSGGLQRQAAALQAQTDDYKQLIELQVTQAWLNLSETQQRIKALGQVLEQSAENLKMTQNRYREGLVSSSEVLEAQNLRQQSLGNHTSATYDSALAWIRLQRMTGEL